MLKDRPLPHFLLFELHVTCRLHDLYVSRPSLNVHTLRLTCYQLGNPLWYASCKHNILPTPTIAIYFTVLCEISLTSHLLPTLRVMFIHRLFQHLTFIVSRITYSYVTCSQYTLPKSKMAMYITILRQNWLHMSHTGPAARFGRPCAI